MLLGRIIHWHLGQVQSGRLNLKGHFNIFHFRGVKECLLAYHFMPNFYAHFSALVMAHSSFSSIWPKMEVRANYWVGLQRDLHGIRQCQSKGWMEGGLHKGRHTVGCDLHNRWQGQGLQTLLIAPLSSHGWRCVIKFDSTVKANSISFCFLMLKKLTIFCLNL